MPGAWGGRESLPLAVEVAAGGGARLGLVGVHAGGRIGHRGEGRHGQLQHLSWLSSSWGRLSTVRALLGWPEAQRLGRVVQEGSGWAVGVHQEKVWAPAMQEQAWRAVQQHHQQAVEEEVLLQPLVACRVWTSGISGLSSSPTQCSPWQWWHGAGALSAVGELLCARVSAAAGGHGALRGAG